jgi:hypothetical protein
MDYRNTIYTFFPLVFLIGHSRVKLGDVEENLVERPYLRQTKYVFYETLETH